MKVFKISAKILAFLLIFSMIFFTAQSILVGDSDTRDSERIAA